MHEQYVVIDEGKYILEPGCGGHGRRHPGEARKATPGKDVLFYEV
jgi:hypothetical protein